MAHNNNETIAAKLAKLGIGLTVCSGRQVSFTVAGRTFAYDTAQHVFTEHKLGTHMVSYADVCGALESFARSAMA